jgi:hypothetical protein
LYLCKGPLPFAPWAAGLTRQALKGANKVQPPLETGINGFGVGCFITDVPDDGRNLDAGIGNLLLWLFAVLISGLFFTEDFKNEQYF